MTESVSIPLPQVFDAQMNPIKRVNPTKVSYKASLTPLSTASMTLEGESVQQGQLVRLFESYGSIGVFRVSKTEEAYEQSERQTVTLEHVLCTLGDTVIPTYYEFGGVGVSTRQALVGLLSKQSKQDWILGDCDFTEYFQYSVENEYLINAVLSVAKPLAGDYQWAFDTDGYPFILSLKKADTAPSTELRLGRNVQSVKRTVDRSDLRTRLYPRGYGEGVNQLGIRDVNNGVDYVEKNTAVWGVVEDVYPDTAITEAATLKAAALAALETLCNPRVITEITADDVYTLTEEPMDALRLGRLARVPMPEYGISLEERIVEVSKQDVYGQPHKATVTLCNQKSDVTGDAAELIRKTRIGELYSQGSTCLYALSFADNCDEGHPLKVRIPVDRNAASINELRMTFDLGRFRSTSRGAASGGGKTSGGGGGAALSEEAKVTSYSTTTTGPKDMGYDNTQTAYVSTPAEGKLHRHSWPHDHNVTIRMTIPALSFQVPGHSHSLPDHTHHMEYGVYEAAETASAVAVSIDGQEVPRGISDTKDFDAVAYMGKDSAGRITRGWHTLTFTPNAMARISGTVYIKTFVTAFSGGNY
ncbi:MAG: phage tail spike protein [Clostridia bacterium]